MIAGVDGCKVGGSRTGWIAVSTRTDFADAAVEVFADVATLVAALPVGTIIAVDMPMGLPDEVGRGGRGPEPALRDFLGSRRSSVFSTPSRRAIYAEGDHSAACVVALETSRPPRKVSLQGFHLFPRIRQIDAALRADPSLISRMFETHPEGSFAVLNAGAPLRAGKKSREGRRERTALLAGAGFHPAFLNAKPPSGAGRDDLLDACAACWSAARIAAKTARSFPDPYTHDSYGIPVVIRA